MVSDTTQHGRDSFLLESYGDILKCYKGEGELLNERHSATCRFEAGQLRNGDVVILCDFLEPVNGLPFCFSETPERLEGTTIDGRNVLASGSMMQRNWLSEVPSREGSVVVTAFHAQQFSVTRPTKDESGCLIYGVTNFSYCRPFSVPLELGSETLRLEVRPTLNAKESLKRLQTVKGTDVMAEVRVEHPHAITQKLAEEAIDDFCHVASVALGTHIQWVFMRRVDTEHQSERIEHYNRFAKPYCGLAVIDPRSAHRNELPSYIVSALPRYRERRDRWNLHRGPIAAYLDAKSEGDWLETRAAKISVAIESLKAAFLESKDADVDEFILDPDDYDRLVPKLQASCRNALGEYCIAETAKLICSDAKLKGLNRRSFRYFLKKLVEHIGFSPSKVDIKRFIDSRNSLVHTGRFHSDDPVAEWLFLVNMLDRFYLKLLGYSGPYLNWTRSVDDRRDTLE